MLPSAFFVSSHFFSTFSISDCFVFLCFVQLIPHFYYPYMYCFVLLHSSMFFFSIASSCEMILVNTDCEFLYTHVNDEGRSCSWGCCCSSFLVVPCPAGMGTPSGGCTLRPRCSFSSPERRGESSVDPCPRRQGGSAHRETTASRLVQATRG